MSSIASNKPRSGGFRALRFAALVALSGLGVAVFLVSGSYLFWQSERSSDSLSQRNLQELRNRLESLKRERADLEGSEETYKSLLARGAFAPEKRLDLIETMLELKKRHKLLELEYEIGSQRPLKFATGASYSAVGIMASRMQVKIKAYQDADLVAFLDEFPRIQRGFFPIDKCAIKRIEGVDRAAKEESKTDSKANAKSDVTPAPAGNELAPTIEAECTLEWVTMVDKSKPAIAPPADARKT